MKDDDRYVEVLYIRVCKVRAAPEKHGPELKWPVSKRIIHDMNVVGMLFSTQDSQLKTQDWFSNEFRPSACS